MAKENPVPTWSESMRVVRSCEDALGSITISCRLTPQQQQRTFQSREEREVVVHVVRHELRMKVSRESTARKNLAIAASVLRAMADWKVSTTAREAGLWLVQQLFHQYLLLSRPSGLPPPTPQIPEHYRVLHLAPGAPLAVAEAAYRTLARQCHPDAGGDPEQMIRLNAAIERLRKELA